ncbi:MAG: c-type cytochrome [Acetobacteraceae bacterium]|jgi:cytochrome c1
MALSNGAVVVAATVIVAGAGVAAYAWLQEVQDLRLEMAEVSKKTDSADAAAAQADTTATQAVVRAGQAVATAARAEQTADQARVLAVGAKETVDRAAATPAGTTGLATASPAPAQPTAASETVVGHDLAILICAACHVVAPDQHTAPTLKQPAPDFHAIANRPATTDSTLHDFMLKPHGNMPDMTLAEYQVTALVDYMMSLRDRR